MIVVDSRASRWAMFRICLDHRRGFKKTCFLGIAPKRHKSALGRFAPEGVLALFLRAVVFPVVLLLFFPCCFVALVGHFLRRLLRIPNCLINDFFVHPNYDPSFSDLVRIMAPFRTPFLVFFHVFCMTFSSMVFNSCFVSFWIAILLKKFVFMQ